MFLNQIQANKEEAYNLQRSHSLKVFCPMTLTLTLSLQMVDFRREEALTLSLEMEDDQHKTLTPKRIFIRFHYKIK